MIIVYPMLVSRAVSENSIPGIAKTVENYIMVNMQNEVISNKGIKAQTRGGTFKRVARATGKLIFKEGDEILSEAIPPGSGPGSKGKGVDPQTRQMYDQEQDILDAQWKDLDQKEKEIERKIEVMQQKIDQAMSAEEKNRLAREKAELDREKFEYQQKQDEIRRKQKALEDEMRRREREDEREFRTAEKEKEREYRDAKDAEKEAREKASKAKEKAEEKEKLARSAKAEVRVQDMKSISLEPTYMEITVTRKDGSTGRDFLGVKVVPIRVKSDVKLSHLLLYDTKVNALFAVSLALGRKIMRKFWSFFDKWTHRLRIGGLTASGDPRRDIIMGRTGMGDKSRTFIVLSKQEDVDEFFIDNIQKINRLYKMGWDNFVIADDIARVAWFCTKEFKGMCSSVPYAMMYQYLGQSKAYETMEDAKKANSSIFKISKRFSRIIGECKTELLLYKYSQLSEGNHDE